MPEYERQHETKNHSEHYNLKEEKFESLVIQARAEETLNHCIATDVIMT